GGGDQALRAGGGTAIAADRGGSSVQDVRHRRRRRSGQQHDRRRRRLRPVESGPLIFVDTSFLVAGLISRDRHHQAAVRLSRQIAGRRVVTTNHVRGESWAWIRRKAWHGKAVEMLDNLEDPNGHVGVSSVSEQMEHEALAWLRQHDEREYSFVDA